MREEILFNIIFERRNIIPKFELLKILPFQTFFHIYFFEREYIVPVCIFMEFLPVVNNIEVQGMLSQVFDIGPNFYFTITFFVFLKHLFFHFIKWKLKLKLQIWDTFPCL